MRRWGRGARLPGVSGVARPATRGRAPAERLCPPCRSPWHTRVVDGVGAGRSTIPHPVESSTRPRHWRCSCRPHAVHTRAPIPNKERRLSRSLGGVAWTPARWSAPPPAAGPRVRLRPGMWSVMSDYTSLGIAKLARQAATHPLIIRCPRDGVVMRVLRCCADRTGVREEARREFGRVPPGREWRVREIDVECPACRRRALGVTIAARPSDGQELWPRGKERSVEWRA